MSDFLAALALALVIEGLLYAGFPDQMKRALSALLDTDNSIIRVVALTCSAAGLIVLYLIRS